MREYICLLGKDMLIINAQCAQVARQMAVQQFNARIHMKHLQAWIEKGWMPNVKPRRIKVIPPMQVVVDAMHEDYA